MFYTRPDFSTAGRYQEPLESPGTASDWDVLSSSYKSMVESNSFLSGEWNLRSTYDDHNKKVQELTGEKLANPQFDLRMDPFQGSNKDRSAYWESYRKHRRDGGEMDQKDYMDQWIEKNYRLKLEGIAAKYPELRSQLLPVVEFKHQAYQRAQKAEKNEREVWNRSNKGAGSYAAWMAGGLGAAAVDPVNWLTAPIGWGRAINGARGLALAFAKGGAANALAEGIIQFTPGGVQDYRSEAGLHSGVGPGLEAMQGAFLFGGLLDAGVRGLARGTRWSVGHEPVLRGDEIIGWRKKGTAPDVTPSAPLPRSAEIPEDLRQRAADGDAGAQAEILARLEDAGTPTPKADDAFIPVELAKRAEDGDTAAIREIAKITGQDKDPVTVRALDEMDLNEALIDPPDPAIKPSEHVKGIDQALRHVSDPINEPPPVVRAGRTIEEVLDIEDNITSLEARFDMHGLDEGSMRLLEDLKDERMAIRRELMSDEFIAAIDNGEVSPDVAGVVLDHVGDKDIQARAARDLMERGVATAEQARRELAEILSSPDYREAPFDGGAKQLDDPYGPDAVRQVEDLERELAEELGLDPADITKPAEVKPREALIKEAIDRADQVKAAINDLSDIIPDEVNVRVFSSVDELPPGMRGRVANANARLFGAALRQFENAKTVGERSIARANLNAAKRGAGVEGIANGSDVWISSYAMNPTGRVAHEVVHALRTLGKIAPEELEALAERAVRAGYFTEDAARLYGAELESRGYDAATVKDLLVEEAAAHIIDARIKSGVIEPDARTETILGRVMEFFDGVRSRLRGQKFMTAAERAEAGDLASNDAMRAFITGEMARREANGDWSRKSPDYRQDVVDLRGKIGKLEDELQAVPAEARYRDPETGEPMTDADVNSFVDMWKFVNGSKRKKAPKTLSQFIVEGGGLYDDGGDVLQILGEYRQRPTLVNKLGEDLDDVALAAWNAGYIPTSERATINDLLEMLSEDLSGNPIYREADGEFADQIRLAQEMENDLAEAGLGDVKKAGDIRKHFDGTGKGGASGRSSDTIRAEIDQARTELDAAQRTASDADMFAIRKQDDQPITPGLDMSQAARLSRARDMGFDTERVLYHGTQSDEFAAFESDIETKAGELIESHKKWSPVGAADNEPGSRSSRLRLVKDDGDDMYAFGGESAANADKKSLQVAKMLSKRKVKREEIFEKTGWFKGLDSKWRFEIDDSPSKMSPAKLKGLLDGEVDDIRLGDILDNPKLYEAYPGLEEITTAVQERRGAAFSNNVITINRQILESLKRGDKNEALEMAMHEVQHAIQRREKFARGGNPESSSSFPEMEQALLKSMPDFERKNFEDALKYLIDKGVDPEENFGFKNPLDYIDVAETLGYKRSHKDPNDNGWINISNWDPEQHWSNTAFETYQRLAGEVEARTVEKRLGMTPEERKARPPWLDYDVPEADQIIRTQDGNMMFAMRAEQDSVLYRGEPKKASGGLGHHYTRSFARAKGFAGEGGQVFAVRVPIERMGELKPSREAGNVVLPKDLRETRQPVSSPQDMGMMFALGGNRPPPVPGGARADVDTLGFYSGALKAARGIKQSKGTPEQMLSMLTKGGAKPNEIEATGLDKFLKSFEASDADRPRVAPKLNDAEQARAIRSGARIQSGRAYFDEILENPSKRDIAKLLRLVGKYRGQVDDRGILRITVDPNGNIRMQDSGAGTHSDLTHSPVLAGFVRRDGVITLHGANDAGAPDLLKRMQGTLDGLSTQSVKLEEFSTVTSDKPLGPSSNPQQVTRDGIISFLELQRVKVMEGQHGDEAGLKEAYYRKEKLQAEAIALGASDKPRQQELFAEIQAINDKFGDGDILRATETKWSSYSLDPSNTTYREDVLHMPVADAAPKFDPAKVVLERKSQSASQHSITVSYDGKTLLNGAEDGGLTPHPDQHWIDYAKHTFEKGDKYNNNPNMDNTWRNGHFDEPNQIGHERWSLQPDAEGKINYTVSEYQADQAQKIRDAQRNEAAVDLYGSGYPEYRGLTRYSELDNDGKTAVRKAIKENPAQYKGTRDEAKIAELTEALKKADSNLKEAQKDWAVNGGAEKGKVIQEAEGAQTLLKAELATAEGGLQGHPFINSDQYITTMLRRSLRKAVESGADYIAISSGDTVDSFKMGAPREGLLHYYDVKYPQEMKKIISKIDKAAAKPEKIGELKSSDGKSDVGMDDLTVNQRGSGFEIHDRDGKTVHKLSEKETQKFLDDEYENRVGFVRFPITDKLRAKIMEDGQPLFAMRDMEGRKKFGASDRAQLLQEDIAEIEAKFNMAEGKDREKLHAKRAALLNSRGLERALDVVDEFRDMWGRQDRAKATMFLIESFGESKGMDAKHLQEAIQNRALEGMQKLLWRMRKGAVLGDLRRTKNESVKTDMDDMIRAAAGEEVNNPDAKLFAQEWLNTAEYLRQRFNAAGGDIKKLKGWFAPQYHNAEGLLKVSKEVWVDRLMQENVLDRDRMVKLSGEALTEPELRTLLREVWETVTTDGANKRDVGESMGRGALYKRHMESRVLHFKNADAWLNYNKEFGGGDVYAAMIGHTAIMSRDIALMERFGPNPHLVWDRLKNTLIRDASMSRSAKSMFDEFREQYDELVKGRLEGAEARAQAIVDKMGAIHAEMDALRGKRGGDQEFEAKRQELFEVQNEMREFARQAAQPDETSQLNQLLDLADEMALMENFMVTGHNPTERTTRLLHRADEMMKSFNGTSNVPSSTRIANAMQATRNYIGASILPFASISAISDQATSLAARKFIGMPASNQLSSFVKGFTKVDRQASLAVGLGLDQARNAYAEQIRMLAQVDVRNTSGFVADRTHAYSGLAPMTQAAKVGFGLDFMRYMAGHQGTEFVALPDPVRTMFERHGVSVADWDAIRSAQPETQHGGAMLTRNAVEEAAGTDLAEKYMMVLMRERAFAVLEGTTRSRTGWLSDTKGGSLLGELSRSFAFIKTFPTTYMLMVVGRSYRELLTGNKNQAAAYATAVFVGGTLMGAVALQLKNIAHGRDIEDMTTLKFWLRAFAQAGGVGILGDFIGSSINRFGDDLGETLAGPVFSKATEFQNLTLGNVFELAQGKDTKFPRELTRFMRGNTPMLPFYLRVAYERMILDNILRGLDPDADAVFRRQKRGLKKRTGQNYSWEPGAPAPRGLNFSAALGKSNVGLQDLAAQEQPASEEEAMAQFAGSTDAGGAPIAPAPPAPQAKAAKPKAKAPSGAKSPPKKRKPSVKRNAGRIPTVA